MLEAPPIIGHARPARGFRITLSATLAALVALAAVPRAAGAQDPPPAAPDRPMTLFSAPETPVPATVQGVPAPPAAPQDAGFLGVAIENLSAEEAREMGLSDPAGVRIREVVDESPAAGAGLQEGDVILEWDGQPVSSVLQLQRMVRETPPGRTVRLNYLRDGQRSRVTVTVAEPRGMLGRFQVMDEDQRREMREQMEKMREQAMEQREQAERARRQAREHAMEQSREAREQAARARRQARVELRRHLEEGEAPMAAVVSARFGPRIGLRLNSLTGQLAGYFGLEDRTGALVVSVEDDSPAREAGIRAGDVILSAGGEEVDSPGDVARAVRGSPGEDLEIQLLRRGERQMVAVAVPEHEGPSAMVSPQRKWEFQLRELEPAMRDLEIRLRRIEPRLQRSLEDVGPQIRRLLPALRRGLGSGIVII